MSIFIQSLSLTTATAGAYSLNEAAVNTELCIFGYSTAICIDRAIQTSAWPSLQCSITNAVAGLKDALVGQGK